MSQLAGCISAALVSNGLGGIFHVFNYAVISSLFLLEIYWDRRIPSSTSSVRRSQRNKFHPAFGTNGR